MTARSGMTELIEQLRGMTDAGTSDFTLGTTVYWNDDAAQRILDKHRRDFTDFEVSPLQFITNGTADWRDYYLPWQDLESGTLLQVKNSAGTAYGTSAYALDAARGVITWGSNAAGSSILVTGRYYDLPAAAAEVWRFKASNVAKMYDFSTDNHRLNRSQIRESYLDMAKYYEAQALPRNMVTIRADLENYDVD